VARDPFFAFARLKADTIAVTRNISALDFSNVELVVLPVLADDVPVPLFLGEPLNFSLHMHSL
jgi:hypothetical protein